MSAHTSFRHPHPRTNLIQMLNTLTRNTLLSVTSGCKQTNNQEQLHISIWLQSHSTWLHKMVTLPNLRVSSVTNFGLQLSTAVWTYTQGQHDTVLFLHYRCRSDVEHQKYHCECTQWRKLDQEMLSYVKVGT